MKTIFAAMLIIFLVFFGCSKSNEGLNSDLPSAQNLELKKAKVPVPIKMDFCFTLDRDLPSLPCLPEGSGLSTGGGGWFSGNASHFGKIKKELSYGKTTYCTINESGQWIQTNEGIITASNGDYCNFVAHTITTLPELTFTGDISFNDGTGIFKGVKGVVYIQGTTDGETGESCWTGSGQLNYQ